MSSKEELQEFEYQLESIQRSLKDDPTNADLLTLQEEMISLIALTREYLGQQAGPSKPAASASTSGPSHSTSTPATASSSTAASTSFTAGTEVLAKWHVDNKMYPARIVSVSGSTADPVYTVIFKIDNSTEVVRGGDVKALSDSKKRVFDRIESSAGKDRGESPSAGGSGSERDNKKVKKVEKVEKKAVKEEERKARVAEQNAKQTSWQSFAKKGVKKGKVHIPGMTGESQFKTPDNPHGRVGVVGSGKGMTTFEQKKRAVWEAKE